MSSTLVHPRDAALHLRATRLPFGSWRLEVNGERVEEDDEREGFRLNLADGTVSWVAIESRTLDPYPVFVIDDEKFPTGLPLGASGIVAILLPLFGLGMGIGGILTGLIGASLTLRVARRWRSPLPRLGAGLGFAVASGVVGITLFRAMTGGLEWGHPIPVQSPIPEPAVLPAVADIPSRGAARYALTHLPPTTPAIPVLAGTDPIAPFSVAELSTLREDVLAGKFGEAESLLVRLEREARQDVRRESRWRAAYRMTFQAEPDTFTAMLDRWVATSPFSPAALTARAWNRYWQAFYWRGETPRRMSEKMARGYVNALANAAEDATEALTLDPDMMPGYWVLQNIARTEGDGEMSGELFVRALTRSPYSYESFTFAMNSLYPEWGGSTEQMARLGAEGADNVARNPDLGRLAGFATWKDADGDVESGAPRVVANARRALLAGPDYRFAETLGHALYHAEQFVEARRMLDSAITLEPTSEVAYETRYKLLNQMARGAGDDSTALYRARDADIRMVYRLRPMMEP